MTDWNPKEEHLVCRDLLHAWQPSNAARLPGGGFVRIMLCMRCSTTKKQYLDEYGYLKRTEFFYPAGYLRPKNAGRLTRADRAKLRVRNVDA